MKILIPVDGSAYSLEAVQAAARLAKAEHTQVTLIHVVACPECAYLELSSNAKAMLYAEFEKRARAVTDEANALLAAAGIEAATEIVVGTHSVPDAIVDYAKNNRIDLIAIGSRGQDPSTRFKLGSVAVKVVRHADCSVLVVKKQA